MDPPLELITSNKDICSLQTAIAPRGARAQERWETPMNATRVYAGAIYQLTDGYQILNVSLNFPANH